MKNSCLEHRKTFLNKNKNIFLPKNINKFANNKFKTEVSLPTEGPLPGSKRNNWERY